MNSSFSIEKYNSNDGFPSFSQDKMVYADDLDEALKLCFEMKLENAADCIVIMNLVKDDPDYSYEEGYWAHVLDYHLDNKGDIRIDISNRYAHQIAGILIRKQFLNND